MLNPPFTAGSGPLFVHRDRVGERGPGMTGSGASATDTTSWSADWAKAMSGKKTEHTNTARRRHRHGLQSSSLALDRVNGGKVPHAGVQSASVQSQIHVRGHPTSPRLERRETGSARRAPRPRVRAAARHRRPPSQPRARGAHAPADGARQRALSEARRPAQRRLERPRALLRRRRAGHAAHPRRPRAAQEERQARRRHDRR